MPDSNLLKDNRKYTKKKRTSNKQDYNRSIIYHKVMFELFTIYSYAYSSKSTSSPSASS